MLLKLPIISQHHSSAATTTTTGSTGPWFVRPSMDHPSSLSICPYTPPFFPLPASIPAELYIHPSPCFCRWWLLQIVCIHQCNWQSFCFNAWLPCSPSGILERTKRFDIIRNQRVCSGANVWYLNQASGSPVVYIITYNWTYFYKTINWRTDGATKMFNK